MTRFLILILSLCLSSCNLPKFKWKDKKQTDTFYTDLGGFGLRRIPLIKPYELLKISDDEWRLELQNPGLLVLSIHHVKGVCARDSLIAIYSEGGTDFLNIQHEKAWFLIEVESGLEKAYDNEKGFIKDFNRYTNTRDIIFHEPDSLYHSFENNKWIVW